MDTGPLVAILNRHDRHHPWAKARLAEIGLPMLTCEAVLAELCFLVRTIPGGSKTALELVRQGVIEIPFRVADHIDPLTRLMMKYADVPMSLADACLVRMSELYADSTVLTLDRDFLVYRKNGRQVIPTLIPPSA